MEIMPGKVCSSCGKLTDKYADIKCPNCAKSNITRCYHCRKTYTPYTCKECNFEGP